MGFPRTIYLNTHFLKKCENKIVSENTKMLQRFILLSLCLILCTNALPMYDEDYYEFDEEYILEMLKNSTQTENIKSFDEETLEAELKTSERLPGKHFSSLTIVAIVLGSAGILVILLAVVIAITKHTKKRNECKAEKVKTDGETNKPNVEKDIEACAIEKNNSDDKLISNEVFNIPL